MENIGREENWLGATKFIQILHDSTLLLDQWWLNMSFSEDGEAQFLASYPLSDGARSPVLPTRHQRSKITFTRSLD